MVAKIFLIATLARKPPFFRVIPRTSDNLSPTLPFSLLFQSNKAIYSSPPPPPNFEFICTAPGLPIYYQDKDNSVSYGGRHFYAALPPGEKGKAATAANPTPNNLTPIETNTITTLRTRKDLTVKPADKGGAIV